MRDDTGAMQENKEVPISDNLAEQIAAALADVAEITAVYTSKKEILLKAIPLVNPEGIREIIDSRLLAFGYRPEILSTHPTLIIRLRSYSLSHQQPIPWLNIGLFFLTILSTLCAGAMWEGIHWFAHPGIFISNPMLIISRGFPFSFSLLAILLCHESGHYITSRIHGVNVSLPYFIPAPTLIGTLGAVIRSRSAFMNRKQLLDVGASGPLAGIVIAIIVYSIGIHNSRILPLPPTGTHDLMVFGDSLLGKLIIYLTKGPIPQGMIVHKNSVAFAGWVGLLVTMLNLLPIGQLDGGHIIYALFGRKQIYLANIILIGLLVLSFWWLGWAIWLVLAILMKPAHPPTLMDEEALGSGRRLIGYISIAVFILCFVPVPVSSL
jgi:membrane-associated protease RseP (regulator of RpoE activity)